MLKRSIQQSPDFKTLNLGQQIAALGAMAGNNMLMLGGGGVGKSHLIRFLASHIPELVLTASTGIAAINIEGQTLDSLMGFNRGTNTPLQARRMDDRTKERLSLLNVLLIDEVSMVRADRLDLVNHRLQAAKNSSKPFGGVQIILVGDFCQLPPVVTNSKSDKLYQAMYGERLFVFGSDCYESANFTPYVLNEYVRQGDEATRRVMRNMRMGHKLDDVVDFFNNNAKAQVNNASLRICKTNSRVDDINRYAFARLKAPVFTAHAVTDGIFPTGAKPANDAIAFKKGCRLLITVNKPDSGYLNGDLGTLIGFNKQYLVVRLDRGKTVYVAPHEWKNHAYRANGEELSKKATGTFTQYPVRLGYAITGHKSQGMTLESAIVDLSGNFNADGLAYVVMSRVKSLDNLKLMAPLRTIDIRTNKQARIFTFAQSMQALERRQYDCKRFGLDYVEAA
jgi:ATP-dependent exoDNAse (exonuclease V) alpha subunit